MQEFNPIVTQAHPSIHGSNEEPTHPHVYI